MHRLRRGTGLRPGGGGEGGIGLRSGREVRSVSGDSPGQVAATSSTVGRKEGQYDLGGTQERVSPPCGGHIACLFHFETKSFCPIGSECIWLLTIRLSPSLMNWWRMVDFCENPQGGDVEVAQRLSRARGHD